MPTAGRPPERPACFCRATQQGFLRVASGAAFQRSCNIVGLTNRDALAALGQIMASPSVSYREEPPGLVDLWHRLAGLPTASPKVWMDAYLAAFAIAGGMTMVTLDSDHTAFTPAGLDLDLLQPG